MAATDSQLPPASVRPSTAVVDNDLTTKRLRFIIFGGTGPCGILLIRKALEVYPKCSVIVYARSPQKIPSDLTSHPQVKIVEGTLEELDKVEQAFSAQPDALLHSSDSENTSSESLKERGGRTIILSALGPPVMKGITYPSNHPIATFYDHLIDIMFKLHVKRLIVMCTASHPDPKDKVSGNILTYGIITTVKMFAHGAYLDFKEVGNVIRRKGGEGDDVEKGESDVGGSTKLDWTLVRVPILTNKDKEDVFAGYVGDGKTGNALTRKAFAAFCVGEVEKREWVRKAPYICTPGCV